MCAHCMLLRCTMQSQKDRLEAIQEFKEGKRDVLVASDVASKGLDFPDIQHVINYDMPKEIEDYVRRYRLSRCFGLV
jgi:ATP-dependent RNA helicase DDX41